MPLPFPAEAKQLSKKMKFVLTMSGREYCSVDNMLDTKIPDIR